MSVNLEESKEDDHPTLEDLRDSTFVDGMDMLRTTQPRQDKPGDSDKKQSETSAEKVETSVETSAEKVEKVETSAKKVETSVETSAEKVEKVETSVKKVEKVETSAETSAEKVEKVETIAETAETKAEAGRKRKSWSLSNTIEVPTKKVFKQESKDSLKALVASAASAVKAVLKEQRESANQQHSEAQHQDNEAKTDDDESSTQSVKKLDTKVATRVDTNVAEPEVELSDVQKDVLRRVSAFENVFMTGSAGTGKSEVIKYVKKALPLLVHVTALTGRAALMIGGKTLHSWAGIGLGTNTWQELVNKMSSKTKQIWCQNELILVVDEVSMLSLELFEKLDKIGKFLRGNQLPFGGITLLFSGDFKQLPPVKADLLLKSELFMKVFPPDKTVQLTTNFRQQADTLFQDILKRVSMGEQTLEDQAVLSTRLVKPPPDKCVTRIYPLKRQAESFNASKMKGLKGEEHEFVHAFHALKRLSDQEQAYLEKQLLNAPCEPRIVLKVGAVVMQIVNSTPDGASFRKVNGSLGVVEDFDATTNNPIVRFSDGDLCEVKPYTWVSEDKRLSRSQIPLIIAWAVTAHKIQGASLDAAVMSLGSNVFEDNQAYVMLSRVKTLEGVFLSSFDPSVIRAHPDAVAYYKMLDNHNNSFCASKQASAPAPPIVQASTPSTLSNIQSTMPGATCITQPTTPSTSSTTSAALTTAPIEQHVEQSSRAKTKMWDDRASTKRMRV